MTPAPRQGRPSRSGQPQRTTAGSVDSARRAAYDVLEAVGVHDSYANLAMKSALTDHRLAGRDAAFATELAFGSLRMRGLLDAVIARAAGRDIERIDPQARDILRLAAYQLLFMRVPSHAAVATGVALAHDRVPRAAGFTNAVLRRIDSRSLPDWIGEVAPDPATDPTGYLAVSRSHPRWIVTAMSDALRRAPGGPERLDDLLAVDNTPAPVTLAVRPGLADPADVRARTAGAPGRWSPYAVRLSGGDPGSLAEVRSGAVGVTDEGSQLMALALTAAPIEGRDERWLDMCAGPGGKAALLAAIGADRGASLTALDVHPHRVRLVESALRRIPGAHHVEQADATTQGWSPGAADRVLVDVPCTGLGVLRRRPEARWRRTPTDIAALAPVQRRLLAAALEAVRPGGVVAYVTCSPHIAETELVVRDVLRHHPRATLLPAADLLPDVPDAADSDFVRLWPHLHDTDGMFLAMIRQG